MVVAVIGIVGDRNQERERHLLRYGRVGMFAASLLTLLLAAPRLMVAPVQTSTPATLPSAALTQLAAKVASEVGGYEVVTEREIDAAFEQLRREHELGCLEDDCLIDLGGMAQARFLLATSVGVVGDRVFVAASLVDTDASEVAARSSVSAQREQLGEALRVAVRRVLGQEASVEAIAGAEPALNTAIGDLAAGVARAFRAHAGSPLARLGYLPLAQRGADVRQRELGAAMLEVLLDRLGQGEQVPIVEADRVQALAKQIDLSAADRLDAIVLKDAARVMGCAVVLRGAVTDIGDHFLLTLELDSTDSGAQLWRGRVALARGPGLSALAERALVKRTTSGAVFRAALGPGWGQFYNGQPIKGGLVLGGVVAALGSMATALALSSGKNAKAKTYDRGDDPVAWRAMGCATRAPECAATSASLQDDADTLRAIALGTAGAALFVHVVGIIDAGLSAEDYSRVSLTSANHRTVSLGLRF